MFLILFLLLPIIAAVGLLFVRNEKLAGQIALATSLFVLLGAVHIILNTTEGVDMQWLAALNSRFTLTADGVAKILILLTAISFPAILIATQDNQVANKNNFLSLMLFTQAGLMGVFLAGDALLFYFF